MQYEIIYELLFCQKQSFADVWQNRRSYKFREILKKAPVPESFLNKVAGQL